MVSEEEIPVALDPAVCLKWCVIEGEGTEVRDERLGSIRRVEVPFECATRSDGFDITQELDAVASMTASDLVDRADLAA